MNGDRSWSLGVLVGLPFVLLLAAVGVAVVVLGVRLTRAATDRTYDDRRFFGRLVIGAGVVLLLVAANVLAWGFYPYKAEYHQWRIVSGEVTDVNSRLLSTGKSSISQRFVVEIDGQAYGCDDTRCASVKVGDVLTISCKREWQYAGVDGYGCNFVANEDRP